MISLLHDISVSITQFRVRLALRRFEATKNGLSSAVVSFRNAAARRTAAADKVIDKKRAELQKLQLDFDRNIAQTAAKRGAQALLHSARAESLLSAAERNDKIAQRFAQLIDG